MMYNVRVFNSYAGVGVVAFLTLLDTLFPLLGNQIECCFLAPN